MALNYVALTITVQDAGQDAGTGPVLVAPTGAVTAAGVTVVSPQPVSRQLSNGAVTINLVATDNAGTTPEAGFWAYQVTLPGQQPQLYLVNFADGPSQRLDALTPVIAKTTFGPAASSGGFASPMTTAGDLIVGGASGAAQRLAVNATGTREFVRSVSGATALDVLEASDIPDLSADYVPVPAPVSPAPSKYAPLLYGAVWNWPWKFWPDKYGMKMDGRVFEDATVTSGSLTTLTSATANFTSADVGKSGLGWSGTSWYAFTIAGRNNSTSVTISPAAPGAFTAKGCVIATDDSSPANGTGGVSPAQAWLDAGLAYAQGGPQEAELYMPPLLSGWATAATIGTTTGGGNAQLGWPNLDPASSLPCTLVMRSDGRSAGPDHWLQVSRNLPGACIVSMRNDGSLDTTYGPTSVIGGPVSGMGGGGGLFSNCRARFDGLTIAAPFSATHYCGLELYGLGQASVGDYTYLPMGIAPAAGPWPQFDANAVSAYSYGLRLPSNGNNALSEVDQYTCYGTQISLIASEHARIASMRTLFGVYGWLPMTSSGGSMSHGVSVQNWCCESVKYPVGSVSSGFFALGSPIGITVARLDIESSVAYVNDAAAKIYGDVNFNIIDSPGSYVTDTAYAAGSGKGIRLRRIEASPGLVSSPHTAPTTGSAWLNGYYRDAEITLSISGGSLSALLTDSGSEVVPSGATWYRFMLPPGHSYTPTYSGTATHTVKLL